MSCRQGFYWWEIDITYYALLGLEKIGLIWDLKIPPAHILSKGRSKLPSPKLSRAKTPGSRFVNLNQTAKEGISGFYLVAFDYPDQGAPYAQSGTAMVTLDEGRVKGYSSELIFDGSYEESASEAVQMDVFVRPRGWASRHNPIAEVHLKGNRSPTGLNLTAPFPDHAGGGVANARFHRKGVVWPESAPLREHPPKMQLQKVQERT